MYNNCWWRRPVYVFVVLFDVISGTAFATETVVTEKISGADADGVITLAHAVDIAVKNSSVLASFRAKSDALTQIPQRVSSLDDPKLSVGLANLPIDDFGLGNDPMSQIQIAVSQALPFPGTLDLRENSAVFIAEASKIDTQSMQLRLVQQVKQMWWQIYYNDKALETVHRNQALLRQLIDVVQVKYKVGKGKQQDVLLAHLELSALLDKDIQLREARRNSVISFNTLLNRKVNHDVLLPKNIETAFRKLVSKQKLLNWARQSHPSIMAKLKRIESAESNVALAKKEKYPNFQMAAVYGQREGRSDLASFQFGMSLPIFTATKQNKLIDQRKSELMEMTYGLDDFYRTVDSEVITAVSKFESAREQAILYKSGIIPQARQTVDSMRAGYQVNQVDFLNLVRTQITLYNYETQYWQAISLAKQSLAQLEAAVGRESIYE